LANQELPNLPLAGLDFPETIAASNLTDIDAKGNEALVSLLSTVEQDNSIEAKAKADILGKIARGYAKLGNDDDARFKSEVLKSAKNWKAESDAGKKKALLDGVLDTVVKLGTGPARKPNT
jgi:hypothetical protein